MSDIQDADDLSEYVPRHTVTFTTYMYIIFIRYVTYLYTGADPGFQVRGGVGRREHFWGISCEKSRFYAKKSYFSNFRGVLEIFGVFHVKNHDCTPNKSYFFQF